MGNRSRRRRRADGTISPARSAYGEPSPTGSANDPLYGIPDTNMPYLASIRMARALTGRVSWRRWYAVYWLASLLLCVLGTGVVLAVR